MSNTNDFIIENGDLNSYAGSDSVVIIPEGVRTIRNPVFTSCDGIISIQLPDSLLVIGKWVLNKLPAQETVLHALGVQDGVCLPMILFSGKKFSEFSQDFKDSIAIRWLDGTAVYDKEQADAINKYVKRVKDRLISNMNEDNAAAVAALLRMGNPTPEKLEEYIRKFSDGAHPRIMAVLMDHKERTVPKAKAEEIVDKELGIVEKTAKDWAKVYRWEEENGTITLTKYKGADRCVEIPWDIEGVPVTKIGKNAFKGNMGLEEVRLAPGIVEIGEAAFEGCEKLALIGWNDVLKVIGKRAFYGCYQLTVIRLPASVVELGVNSFGAKFNFGDVPLMHLSEVYLPESVKVYKQFLGEFSDYSVGVHFQGKKTKITAKDFFGAEVRLHVPVGSKTEEYAKKANIPFVAE